LVEHWAHQPTGTYYNGVKHEDVPTAEQLGIDREYLSITFLTDHMLNA
jgi:hypothetical protein